MGADANAPTVLKLVIVVNMLLQSVPNLAEHGNLILVVLWVRPVAAAVEEVAVERVHPRIQIQVPAQFIDVMADVAAEYAMKTAAI